MSQGPDQSDLFSSNQQSHSSSDENAPLAHSARPTQLEDYLGQEHIFKRFSFLKSPNFPSLILWGPPGVGKTTLAHILAENSGKDLYPFSPVLGGVNELKKLIQKAMDVKRDLRRESIIFIDEIHRFNKAQQDALLPYVEKGDFTLIGATTENPRSSVNRALISRVQVIELKKLSEEDLLKVLAKAQERFEIPADQKSLEFIADHAHGDARHALNLLELVSKNATSSFEDIQKIVLENAREYDRNQNRHYDVISAFIKSLRGSDPDAALLWLAVMLDGGEDPVFIARRLVIFASEDVGNADPTALNLSISALTAVSQIGMPEARINLAQVTTYLASTFKSNAAYNGINEALEYVQSNQTLEVPDHLKNFPPKEAKPYQYPHNFPGHYVKQEYTKDKIPNFYRPTEMGREESIKKRLLSLKS